MKALKMEGQMDSWNDERLDELSQRMDDGFKTARKDLALVRTELKRDIAEVRTELKGDMAQLKTELKGDVAQLKGNLAGVKTGLEEDIAEVKDDLKAEMGEVKGALLDLNKRFDRLLLALMVAGLTFGITVLGVAGGVIVKLT